MMGEGGGELRGRGGSRGRGGGENMIKVGLYSGSR